MLHETAPGTPPFLRPIVIKPRLVDLINRHTGVNIIHLARASRLQIETVRAMALQGQPVQPVVAIQVLGGLEQLTGISYTLADIDMPIIPYDSAM